MRTMGEITKLWHKCARCGESLGNHRATDDACPEKVKGIGCDSEYRWSKTKTFEKKKEGKL